MRILWLLLLGLMSAAGHAQVFDRLYPNSVQIPLAQPLQWVAVDKGTVATPDLFSASPEAWRFQPYTANTILPTSGSQEVWVRFALPTAQASATWFIRIPRTNVALVSLFSTDAQGKWRVQSAGESIAPAKWALRTRTPSFEVYTSASTVQTYYLRFEHRSPIAERPMLVSPIEYVDGASRVGILIGLLIGMFGLLSLLSVAAFAIARNTVFLWFGAFVVALMLSQATLIGFGGWRLWPNSAYLNQVMGWVTACLALATCAWFCAKASYAKDSHIWLYRLLGVAALGSLALAVMAAANIDVLPRQMRNVWVASVTAVVIGSLVWMALRGQRWNAVLLMGLVPIGLATLARLAYNLGWAGQLEFAQTAGIFSTILGLLWLMLALVWRGRTALLSSELAAALITLDAPTGLVQEWVAMRRLSRTLKRANQLQLGCGVIMLRWLDFAELMKKLSPEKQNILLKNFGQVLNKAARDIDTAARLGSGYFLLLVEGPISRTTLSSLSTQILTACIRLSDKFDMPNAFNFHIAIWQASMVPSSDAEVLELLRTRLNQMSTGTKRPVQFVDTFTTDPEPVGDKAFNLRRDELIGKIDAIEAAPSWQAPLTRQSDKS